MCSLSHAEDLEKLSGKYEIGPDGVQLAAVTLIGEINEEGKQVPFAEPVRTFILLVALIDPAGKNPTFIFSTPNLDHMESIQNSKIFEVLFKKESNSFTITGKDKKGKVVYTHEVKVRSEKKPKEEKPKRKQRSNSREVMVT